MSDTVEQNLRTALLDLAESRPTDADARLCAIDYHPRTRRRLRWPVAGLAGTLVAVGAAIAAVLLSSGAPEAFAGWTAVPTTPTPSALVAATAACNAMHPYKGPLTGTPVLTEARDKYTAAIYVTPSTGLDHVCISDGVVDDTDVGGGQDALRFSAAPGADQLGMPTETGGSVPAVFGAVTDFKGQVPSLWTALTASQRARIVGSEAEQDIFGLAGHDVQSVTLVFDRGITVNATVEHGWYFAWWPGADLPNTVQTTTNSGTTTTSPVPGTDSWDRACPRPSGKQSEPSSTSSCGVFATGERPSAIRKQQAYLKAHRHTSVARAAHRR
jgi:hypothetical protein